MATYQKIQKSFWTDPKVDDNFTPEDKYFYLYLLTNPHGNMCGCYEISMNQMKRETGYLEDTVRKLIERMQKVHDVIRYDAGTNEILLLNWFKYNWSNSPKVAKPTLDDINLVKNRQFKEFLTKLYEEAVARKEPPNPKSIDTVSIQYPYSSDTLSRVEKSRDRAGAGEEDSLFDKIWMTYPKKAGDIKEAFREYTLAVDNGAKPEVILTAVQNLAATKSPDELQYLPALTKWLRNRAWIKPTEANPVILNTEKLARRAAETAAYLAEGG